MEQEDYAYDGILRELRKTLRAVLWSNTRHEHANEVWRGRPEEFFCKGAATTRGSRFLKKSRSKLLSPILTATSLESIFLCIHSCFR